MNTSKSRFDLKMPIRAAALLGLSALAGAMAAQPSQSNGAISEKVSFAGLDLSTPEGMSAARGRVRAAAHRLCFKLADMQDLSHHANYLDCVDEAVTGAMLQISGAAPSQVAQSRAGQVTPR